MDNVDIESQKNAASQFKSLHTESKLFVMPCAWDAFSALLFERAGFQCLGTTSEWTRATFGLVQEAANQIIQSGTFDYLSDAISETQVNEVLNH